MKCSFHKKFCVANNSFSSPFPENNLLSVQIVVLVKKYYSGMNRNISNYYSKLIDGGSAMAAEATAKDSKGNNALHLLAQEKKLDDIEYAMEFLPISLLEENNHEGLCPMDIIREKITRRKKDD